MNACLGSTPLTETPAFRIFCGRNVRGRNVRAEMFVAEMSYIHTNMMNDDDHSLIAPTV